MKKHWPILVGVVVFFTAVLLYIGQQSPAVNIKRDVSDQARTVPLIPNGSSPIVSDTPQTHTPSDDSPRIDSVQGFGSVRVSLFGQSPRIAGLLVMMAENDRQETSKAVASGKKEIKTEIVFANLRTGTKRVVFVPGSPHSSATGDVVVTAGAESAISLLLSDAGVIRGVVVDSLLRPLKGASVAVSLRGVFSPVAKQAKAITLFGGGHSSWGGIAGRSDHSYSQALRSYGFKSDGSVGLATVTDAEGRFAIAGITEGSAEVSVTYETTSMTHVSTVDRESLITLPIQKAASEAKDEFDEVRRTLADLLDRYAQSGGQDTAYLVQVKSTLSRAMEKSTLSKERKEELNRLLDEASRDPK